MRTFNSSANFSKGSRETSIHSLKFLVLTFFIVLMVGAGKGFGQTTVPYQGTCADTLIALEVTYYDHYSNPSGSSNYCDPSQPDGITIAGKTNNCKNYWEFNPSATNLGRKLGCVENLLGANKTPVFKPYTVAGNPVSIGCPNCCQSNQYMSEWFTSNDFVSRKLPKNIVHSGKVEFCRTDRTQGIFEANNTKFFPLTSIPERPKNNEGVSEVLLSDGSNPQNFGFTMTFERKFTYLGPEMDGQDFTFQGDDDVWVYLNGVLIIDIGGIHGPESQTIKLKDALALVNTYSGKPAVKALDTLTLNFFFAERRITGSNFKIKTGFPIIVQQLGPVTFTPNTSTFEFSQNVSIAGDPTAQIKYTVNGGPELTYSNFIPITGTTSFTAYQTKAGWQPSDPVTKTYTHTPLPSQVTATTLVDALTLGTGGDSLITTSGGFNLRLELYYKSITSANVLVTTSRGDTENITLTSFLDGNNRAFTGLVSTDTNAVTVGNGRLNIRPFDKVTVKFTNPLKPNDVDSIVIDVRDAPKTCQVYFANTSNVKIPDGDFITTGTNTLRIVVEDESIAPSSTSTARLTTDSTKDSESMNLNLLGYQKFSGTINYVESTNAAVINNSTVQVINGDRIRLSYTDPDDPTDVCTDVIGANVTVPLQGQVVFLDSLKTNVWNNTAKWNPATGRLTLRFTDDEVAALGTKNVILTAKNVTTKGDTLVDRVSGQLIKQTSPNALTGIWQADFTLQESKSMNTSDNILQWFTNGRVNVKVKPHLRALTEIPDPNQDSVEAKLEIAYPNLSETIIITDGAGANIPATRTSDSLLVCVEDQDFSKIQIDTVYLEQLECTDSRDMITDLKLIQTGINTNRYCTIVKKIELNSSGSDEILTCNAQDKLNAKYKDPVYTSIIEESFSLPDTTNTLIQFLDSAGNVITQFNESSNTSHNNVKIRIKAPDIVRGKADTITVTLFNKDKSDALTVKLTDTETAHGIFESGLIPVGFAITPSTADTRMDGKFILGAIQNSDVITATYNNTSQNLILNSTFNPGIEAWFVPGKMENGELSNDRGEIILKQLIVQFDKPLKANQIPTTITSIDWPAEASTDKSASQGIESFEINRLDSSQLIVTFNKADAPTTKATSIVTSDQPYITLPGGPLFQNQQVKVVDKLGPIIISVIGRSGKGTEPQKDLPAGAPVKYLPVADTLYLTVSEPLDLSTTTPNALNQLLAYYPTDGDGKLRTDIPIQIFVQDPNSPLNSAGNDILNDSIKNANPGSNPTTYRIILSNSLTDPKPNIGDYIFLRPESPYTSIPTGSFGERNKAIPVPVEYQYVNRAPPFSSNIMFNVVGNETADGKRVIAVTPGSEGNFGTEWIPPVGFNPATGKIESSLLATECNANKETAQRDDINRNCYATVLVKTNSKYKANISVFDQFGKFIWAGKQEFGNCGELNNENRIGSQGKDSWLVWNLRDEKDKFVSSGVYIIKVDVKDSQNSYTKYHYQGVLALDDATQATCRNLSK